MSGEREFGIARDLGGPDRARVPIGRLDQPNGPELPGSAERWRARPKPAKGAGTGASGAGRVAKNELRGASGTTSNAGTAAGAPPGARRAWLARSRSFANGMPVARASARL